MMDYQASLPIGLDSGRSPTPRPTVYGYISLQHDDEDEITALHNRLAAYAEVEGLALAEVYVDRNIMPGQAVRPGLTALLDAVIRTDGCGVLIPTANHLSPSEAIWRTIEAEIEVLGGWVTVATGDSAPPLTQPGSVHRERSCSSMRFRSS